MRGPSMSSLSAAAKLCAPPAVQSVRDPRTVGIAQAEWEDRFYVKCAPQQPVTATVGPPRRLPAAPTLRIGAS